MLKINETKKENVGAGLKSLQTNKGITLIALIITIIVMLILVGVTITVAVNGGLFNYAGRAGRETQNAIDKEQTLANGKIEVDGKWYASIDDYLAGNAEPPTYANASKEENGILKENATYTSGEYTAVIPKGFKIIEGLKGTTSIADGLVIQDARGNEFVWIPVIYTIAEGSQKDANGLYPEFLAVFYRSNWVEDDANGGKRGTTIFTANEPYANGYSDGNGTEESKDYYEMMLSVQKNKGFYIGRYEAGSSTPRTYYEADGKTFKANGTTEMVVKRDAFPYNYVGWGLTMSDYTTDVTDQNSKNQGKGALLLSKELYGKTEDSGKYGVVSTLCYSVQWDSMLDFVKDGKHNVTNSTTWGNHEDNLWTITRKTAKYYADGTWNLIDDETDDKKEKTSSGSILLTTGASDDFAAKNIFDVAGNVSERTNEAEGSTYRLDRGGDFSNGGAYSSVSRRSSCRANELYAFVGFRPTLYVK